MTITLRDEGKRIYFAGNTFPAKDAIKGIGGRWDADAKAWWVTPAQRAEAVALVTESTVAQDRVAASLPTLTGKLGERGVSIEQMVQDGRADDGKPVQVVLTTHEAKEANIRQALAAIEAQSFSLGKTQVLRIEQP